MESLDTTEHTRRDHIFIILFVVLPFRATTYVSIEVVDRLFRLFSNFSTVSFLKLVNARPEQTTLMF
jgi:hypothetical protein